MTQAVTARMHIKFIQIPALTICPTLRSPLPKTIAFGGVATGNMNAQLADTAAAVASKTGEKPTPSATAAKIGTIAAVVAVLLVNSVRKTIKLVTMRINTTGGNPW